MNLKKQSAFKARYGEWAVVTGASSGIGAAIAAELASFGLNLVLVARRQGELERFAAELNEKHRVQTQVIACDLADLAGVEHVTSETRNFDVGLFVAAAGFGTAGNFLDAKIEDEFAMLEVNCRAVLALSHDFGRRFARRRRGGLVLFGSLVGFQGTPRAAHYAATKAYVQTLAEGMHVELARHGVDVLASAPGPVESGFAARAKMRMGAAETPATVARATLGALGHRMTVIPGPLSKLLTWSLRTAPRGWRVRIMGKIMCGMTKHLESSQPAGQTNSAPAGARL